MRNLDATGRKMRRPSHPFQIRQKPWIIQPMMIAPVLPGETMKKLLLQARVVSDPVKNPLIGWWQEYYFFYVKHRDLVDDLDLMENMMLEVNADMSSIYTAADVPTYKYATSGINWVKKCYDRVVETYFRSENDTSAHLLDTMHLANISQETWLDSAINKSAFVTAVDVDVDGVDANTTIQASEVDAAMRQWELARAHGLTDMDYEDYLSTFGIRSAPVENHKPELVRYIREWTYPSNTVDPATGVPTSALSWSIADSASKDRFFKEPGFLVGYTISRPKVYLSKQTGSATTLLNSALRWLPAIMRDDPYTSLIEVAATSGPLSSNTEAYWVDLKDLFLYGEQFVNFALTETNAGMVALPTAGLEKRYASTTDVDALFSGVNKLVRQDGVVSLNILGSMIDTTPPIKRMFV